VLESIVKQIENPDLNYISLSNDEIDQVTEDDMRELMEQHGDHLLLLLPPREQEFYSWLNNEDPEVWSDIWGDDAELLVALSYLPDLQSSGPGFLICELVDNPNYFFTTKHITRKGLQEMPYIFEAAKSGKKLSVGEALLFDVMVNPIDIWHFCYKHNVPLQRGKDAAHDLYQLGILVHLTERDDLIKYIDL
jgi:hypothetical protein